MTQNIGDLGLLFRTQESDPGIVFLTPPDTMDWIDRNLVMLRGNAEEKRKRSQIPIESRVGPLKLVCLLIEPV